jgi:DNA-binding NtrC family response regulator
MRAGAFDYVIKPFTPSQIDVIFKKAQAHQQLLQVNQLLSDSTNDQEGGGLVGKSPAMVRLKQLIERVAPTDATVFIAGESGTGKEMIAQEIYRKSNRRKQPFIKVNCAAISENLIESEFFGHERGAFTGANERREGRFELANNGTLLLDEISEISAGLQAKLLRVLQEREFERVGGNRTIRVNVRIIATSNRDLARAVENGTFRSDLFYRLNVFPVILPPLRERAGDIMVLGDHFLKRFSRKHGIKINGFSDSARAAMNSYRWPGNVRELQNVVERAVILTEPGKQLTVWALGLSSPMGHSAYNFNGGFSFQQNDELPLSLMTPDNDQLLETQTDSSSSGKVALTDVDGSVRSIATLEKEAIRQALVVTKGNRTEAAKQLGISIRTLRNKLQEYKAAGDPVDHSSDD